MSVVTRFFVVVCALVLLFGAGKASAQQATANPTANPVLTGAAEEKPKAEPAKADAEEQVPGFRLPDSNKLRVSLEGMIPYGFEPANEGEGRGRYLEVGYFIINLRGELSPRFSYLASINPVDQVAPLPACGEPTGFFPNDPQFLYKDLYARGIGPSVNCSPDGRRQVDMYRGRATDVIDQQGAIREMWLKAKLGGGFDATFGRMILPIGFYWQTAGSMTAKDAPMIQRINAEANSGVLFGYQLKRSDRTFFRGSIGAVLGEGNAWKDYAYQFFQDGTVTDGNKDVTAVASAAVSPIKGAEFMVSYKGGYTGSKIERFQYSYFGGGKHNDRALVLSGRYHFNPYNGITVECARYTWGLAASSARMVGSNPDPVLKNGCYMTAEGGARVFPGIVVGGSYTREEIDRADSMIRYLSEQGLYGVTEGKSDRMSVIRVFVDLNDKVRFGVFRNNVSNPYPWVSGIFPVEGPNAFKGRSLDRWGLVVNFKLQ